MEKFMKTTAITLIGLTIACLVFFLGTASKVDSNGYNFVEGVFYSTLIGMGLFVIVTIIHAIVNKQVRKENRRRI